MSFAAGATGLVLGTIAGVYALTKNAQLDDACHPRDACPLDYRDEVRSLETSTHVSTWSFAAGAVAAGTSLLLLRFHPARKHDPPRASLELGPEVKLRVGFR